MSKLLRGTNRSIIEINETEHKYFERILIFVKPEFGALPAERLSKEAARLVGKLGGEPVGLQGRVTARRRMQKRKKRRALLVGALLGTILLGLLLWKLF